MGGTQDNGSLAHDAARAWDQIAPGDGGDCGVDDSRRLCFHSYFGMWIERARATGPNAFRWVDVSPPVGDDYNALFYPPMEVRASVVAKAGETLFVSGNAGRNWAEVGFGGGPNNRASALAVVNDRTMVLGTEKGDVVQVVRGARGWRQATVTRLARPRNAYISDIAVVGATIWVTSSTFGGAHVLRSRDGGRTWSDRGQGLPDIPANALVLDPGKSSRVFVATDDGVWRTENSGGVWKDFSNGLPNAVVGDILLHPGTRRLRVGTRSRGIWELQL